MSTKDVLQPNSNMEKPFYVVGVGASAGGLEALGKFFSHVPEDTGLAYVVIQHLSPNYKSHMVELLGKQTSMPVVLATDGMALEPNHIYMLPRRKYMTVFNQTLYLMDYELERGIHLPIDIFFRSLAQDLQEKAIGVVLSGTGSDGTRGIRAIKEMNGVVLAQDDSAKFNGMPRSAILTQLVDFICPAENMSDTILNFIQYHSPGNHPEHPVSPLLASDEVTLGKLFAILRDRSQVDFSSYKHNTIFRRIERRMSLHQISDLSLYVAFLQKSKEECELLFKDLLISVTSFFRDPEAFQCLQQQVLPSLFQGREERDTIRVWVPGCATGEEAYSLAILFYEYLEKIEGQYDVKIFATDLDKTALDFASHGVYSESIVGDVSPERLRNYFIKKGGSYEIIRQVRSMVVFARHNLVEDPPFSRMDLVSCRNVLIYMQPPLQQRVLSAFEFSLRQSGFLFLGTSESLGELQQHFASLHNKWKLFHYVGGKRGGFMHLHLAPAHKIDRPSPSPSVQPYRQLNSNEVSRSNETVLRGLVEQVMPPCVVVDESYNLVHAFGNLGPFINAPHGFRVDLNLLRMVHAELSLPLNTALHRSSKEQKETIYRNVQISEPGSQVALNLSVRPFWDKGVKQRLLLVLFEEIKDSELAEELSTEDYDLQQSARQRIYNLEQELQYTKENLQATIEELETANEELQATNEELLAANEELQSTNEELQSVNEEMITVNAEHQAKISELSSLNNDVVNLLSSMDAGTIFLDEALLVRRFTPAAQKEINLLEQDLGRPLNHLSHNFVDVDLMEIARQVLESVVPYQNNIQTMDGRKVLLRVKPYIADNKRVAGVVITLQEKS